MPVLDPRQHGRASAALLRHFGIRTGGPAEEFLHELMDHFTLIPYENLSKIIKRGTTTESAARLRLPDEMYEDFITRRLGGTCFSLTYYLVCLLEHAGLDAYVCMAHAGRRSNVHCVTMVDTGVDAVRYLLDPGYVISAPLPVRRDATVRIRTPHTHVRLDYHRDRNVFSVSTGNGAAMKMRYWFTDLPVSWEDFFHYWQQSFCEGTLTDVCLTIRKGERLVYLHGNYIREMSTQGFRKRRVKTDLHGVISRVSGVREEFVEEALAALAARAKGRE